MQKELNVRPVAEIQNSNDIVGILIKKKWRENGLKQHHKSYQKFTRNTHAHTHAHAYKHINPVYQAAEQRKIPSPTNRRQITNAGS